MCAKAQVYSVCLRLYIVIVPPSSTLAFRVIRQWLEIVRFLSNLVISASGGSFKVVDVSLY